MTKKRKTTSYSNASETARPSEPDCDKMSKTYRRNEKARMTTSNKSKKMPSNAKESWRRNSTMKNEKDENA